MLERALSLHVVQPPCLSLHEAARWRFSFEISTSLLGLPRLFCTCLQHLFVSCGWILRFGKGRIENKGRAERSGGEREGKKEREERMICCRLENTEEERDGAGRQAEPRRGTPQVFSRRKCTFRRGVGCCVDLNLGELANQFY